MPLDFSLQLYNCVIRRRNSHRCQPLRYTMYHRSPLPEPQPWTHRAEFCSIANEWAALYTPRIIDRIFHWFFFCSKTIADANYSWHLRGEWVKLQCVVNPFEPILQGARPIGCQLFVQPILGPLNSHCCCWFWTNHFYFDWSHHLMSFSYPLMTFDGLSSMSLLLPNAFYLFYSSYYSVVWFHSWKFWTVTFFNQLCRFKSSRF